ncbi:MAG: S9 family peptidase [Pseudomonadota bacterium]
MPRGLTAIIVAVIITPLSTAVAEDWPYPEDTPVITPVTVGLAGEKPADIVRYLLANGALRARLSPDGSQIAFSSRITGEPQLWLVDAAGGWPRQITFGSGISFFEWAPDSEHLAIGRDADGNERDGYFLIDLKGEQEVELLPQSDAYRQFGQFSRDGAEIVFSSTERNGRDFDIYLYDIAAGEQRRIYEGTFGFYPAAWQPGGDLLLVDETRGEDGNDVHLLNVRTGKIEPLFQPSVSAAYDGYAWTADGSAFYVTTNQDREYMGLALYDLASGTLRWVDTPDADVENVSLSGSGRYLAWTRNIDGFDKLQIRDLKQQATVEVSALPDGVYVSAFAGDSDDLLIHVSGPTSAGDVFTWRPGAAQPMHAVKASLAGLGREHFVTPEVVRFPARDGVMLQGLLYLPTLASTDATPPLVVNVHGGPTAQARPRFRPQLQYLVNTGIAVLDVNVRGSTGFGKTYARLDNQEKRLDSVRDLVDTVAYFANDDRINGNRVAVMGGSYGGYMVNAVLGSFPGVFDAGVSMVGVSDWVRALQDASPGLKASDRIEYGDISEPRWVEFYRENSPINNAQNIDVPLLVEHGVNDPRDPVTESDRLVQKIRDNGGDVRYLRFPDEGHSLSKQPNRVAFYRAMADFLAETLQPQDRRDNL